VKKLFWYPTCRLSIMENQLWKNYFGIQRVDYQ